MLYAAAQTLQQCACCLSQNGQAFHLTKRQLCEASTCSTL